MQDLNAPNCERQNELVSFLYGELSDAEAPAFERHLNQCVSCSSELAGFKSVRRSVVAWRNESLTYSESPAQQTVSVDQRKPSAIAALRAFFDLSPLWMKAGVALATIVLCLLAGLAIVRWQVKDRQPVVVNNGYTRQQVDDMVAKRLQEERDKLRQGTQSSPTPERVAQSVPVERKAVNPAQRKQLAVKPDKSDFAKRPLSKTEREQLAADLRLLSSGDDIDLLNDSINQ